MFRRVSSFNTKEKSGFLEGWNDQIKIKWNDKNIVAAMSSEMFFPLISIVLSFDFFSTVMILLNAILKIWNFTFLMNVTTKTRYLPWSKHSSNQNWAKMTKISRFVPEFQTLVWSFSLPYMKQSLRRKIIYLIEINSHLVLYTINSRCSCLKLCNLICFRHLLQNSLTLELG